jgi:hypothetical protein
VTRPGYFTALVQSSFGVACIVVGVMMLATAWILIRKIVDIKV